MQDKYNLQQQLIAYWNLLALLNVFVSVSVENEMLRHKDQVKENAHKAQHEFGIILNVSD